MTFVSKTLTLQSFERVLRSEPFAIAFGLKPRHACIPNIVGMSQNIPASRLNAKKNKTVRQV